MPEVRISEADEQVKQEKGQEDAFDHQIVFPAFLQFLFQFSTLTPSLPQTQQDDQAERDGNGKPTIS